MTFYSIYSVPGGVLKTHKIQHALWMVCVLIHHIHFLKQLSVDSAIRKFEQTEKN